MDTPTLCYGVRTKTTDDLAALIQGAQNRETEAYDRLVERYAPRLYGFMYRLLGRREEAEDLVQDVFVRVVRTLDSYEHDGRFEPWLFRIAANVARDRIRRQTRSPHWASLDAETHGHRMVVEAGQDDQPAKKLGIEDSGDASHVAGRLQAALEQLPEPERQVVLLRHYGQMSFADIAAMMETPVGTALARAHRGLAKLRRLMESEE